MLTKENTGTVLLLLIFPFYIMAQSFPAEEIVPYEVKRISRLTGKTQKEEHLPNPNRTDENFNVGGTDLGIAWDMGKGKTGFFFGDTYGRKFIQVKGGGPGEAGDWRSNVLGISSDQDPSDGITLDTMINRQIIYSPHITDGTGSHTTIPTAAIRADGKDYVHYMDVRQWGKAGRWSTNFSGLYESCDHGITWRECWEVKFTGNSNFAQAGYAKKDGYVYMAGTLPGRQGAVYLARFKENEILDQRAYEYWTKTKGWVANKEYEARPIIDDPAGELSIAYHNGYKRWIIVYLSEKARAIVMRDAKEITGQWSEAKILAGSADYPGLYGPFLLPIKEKSDKLYFTMSMWWPYNVFVMEAGLKLAD